MKWAIQALAVFAAMGALDVAWAFYTMSTAVKKPMEASLWASLIVVFSAIVTISYVSDPWLIIPAIGGAFVGTYAAIKLKTYYRP